MSALLFSLVTACATTSTSDVENLQSQDDGFGSSVKQASDDAAAKSEPQPIGRLNY